jgi:hypothetical protein
MKQLDTGGGCDKLVEAVVVVVRSTGQQDQERAKSLTAGQDDLPDDRRRDRIRQLGDFDNAPGNAIQIRAHDELKPC